MSSEDQRAREPEDRRVVDQKARNKASKPKVRHKDPKRGTKARSETQRPEVKFRNIIEPVSILVEAHSLLTCTGPIFVAESTYLSIDSDGSY
jgi:hypothetical protein